MGVFLYGSDFDYNEQDWQFAQFRLKVRNPQNLAGSVPKPPTLANILTQKKEQKSLLLEFVIPAGWSVSAPDAHIRHFLNVTLHSLMRFSTLNFDLINPCKVRAYAAYYTHQFLYLLVIRERPLHKSIPNCLAGHNEPQ